MKRIAQLIESHLNLRVFLPLLILALSLTWYGLFWSVSYFAFLTNGLNFMDMQPTLGVDTLFDQIRAYTPAARRYYLWWSAFDYVWPFITFTTMLFITGWLFRFTAHHWQEKFWLLVALAYLTVLMDWLENIGFALLVTGLPDEPLWLAQTTLALHAAKLVFNMLFNLGFWALLLAVSIIRIRQRLSR